MHVGMHAHTREISEGNVGSEAQFKFSTGRRRANSGWVFTSELACVGV